MNTIICPTCQAPIPANAPGGFCPACLLRDAEEPAPAGRTAPSLEAVAAAFPSLEVQALIGQGGMGFVYRVRQPSLDRRVALKILSPELGRDPAFAERFAREARVLGKLNHPNIVTVFEHGESGGFFYLFMEYVDGVNLRQAMRAGRFTPPQALAVVPGICDALQAAHAQGVWHRDIKPENILLDAQGRVKIADFGIARIVGDPGRDFTLTATGAALGSAAYMAPEQHEKPHDVDHRADIYSLGVVIYEMLTGELPLGRFPAPSERAAVGARIDEIVLQTLEKERALRQQSAGEVKTQVETLGGKAGASVTASAPVENSGLPDVRRMVAAPAIGLMVASSLNVLLYGAWMCFLLFFVGWEATPEGDVAHYTSPHWSLSLTSHPAMDMHPALFWIGPVLGLSLLTFIGAWRMRRLRGHRGAMVGAILGIITPPGMFIGVIFGIWALVVLTRREVKSAFGLVPGDVRRRVTVPAAGLMLAASLNLLLLGKVLYLTVFVARWKNSPTEDVASLSSPGLSFHLATQPGTGVHPALLTVVPLVLILAIVPALAFLGAWRMRQLRSYRLAVVAAIFGLLTPPGLFIGLIFGIWGIAVLVGREVRVAFDGGARRSMRSGFLLAAGVACGVLLLIGAWSFGLRHLHRQATDFSYDFKSEGRSFNWEGHSTGTSAFPSPTMPGSNLPPTAKPPASVPPESAPKQD
ncbi:MAG: protein kinase [Chthoniobacter sp.]|uniref:serine/threonine-protein kinase n=1 Tax=Chthoniobacter sp. TaxID=2510640 RepID=UPI0032ADECBB